MALVGCILLLPVLLILLIAGFFDTGAPLFRQVRVGKNQKPFTLIKFRTMKTDTASVASHLINASAITPLGHFLRRSKLDELPQLWNVVKGEMSLVGPRPCLPNQSELIVERASRGVFDVRPGITGLAQLSGVDMSKPKALAEIDALMINNLTLAKYFLYLFKTISGNGSGDAVK